MTSRIDDLAHLRLGELLEHDDVIQTVQELRTELLLQFGADLILHALVARLGVGTQVEAGVGGLGDVSRTEVGGQDDDGVLEVHLASLAIGQVAVIKHLQQRVEDVRMGLFDLVEQHHGERLAAHLFGKFAALLVADVSRRRTKQTRSRVLLGELGHVHANQRVLIVEQELGERLGQLGLADAGGASEDERTGRTLRILQTDTSTTDGAGQRGNRLVLADDALVQFAFHGMSFLDSAWVSLNTGMPVVWEITSAMTSSSTTILTSDSPSRQEDSFCLRSASSFSCLSRSSAAFSKSWSLMASSLSAASLAIFCRVP